MNGWICAETAHLWLNTLHQIKRWASDLLCRGAHSPVHLIHPYSPPLHHKHGYAGHTLSHPCTVWNPKGTSGAQFGMLEQLSLDSQSHLSHHGNERVHHKPNSSQYISSCPYTGTHLGDAHKRDHEERLRGVKVFSGWQSSIKYQKALKPLSCPLLFRTFC